MAKGWDRSRWEISWPVKLRDTHLSKDKKSSVKTPKQVAAEIKKEREKQRNERVQ